MCRCGGLALSQLHRKKQNVLNIALNYSCIENATVIANTDKNSSRRPGSLALSLYHPLPQTRLMRRTLSIYLRRVY
jgi:hypothetical protein